MLEVSIKCDFGIGVARSRYYTERSLDIIPDIIRRLFGKKKTATSHYDMINYG